MFFGIIFKPPCWSWCGWIVPWNNMLDIITDSHIACSPYLTMAAGSSSKTYNQGVPSSRGWESGRLKDFVMGFGWGIVAGRVRYRGKQGRWYYSRPLPELNHPWNNFWWLWRLYTGGQKLVRLLVRVWILGLVLAAQVLVKLVVCRPCLYYMFAKKRNCLPRVSIGFYESPLEVFWKPCVVGWGSWAHGH